MAWDHVSSALEARKSAFELHANGGIPRWRDRLRTGFADYNDLANRVLRQLGVHDAGNRSERHPYRADGAAPGVVQPGGSP